MSSYTSISSEKLSRLIGAAGAPTLVDVRIDEDFAADPRLIPGATRFSHKAVQDWGPRLTGQSVVVVCQKGQKLSEGTAAWLRHASIGAETLEGGHLGWKEAALPTVPADKIPKRDGRGRTVWVTRSRPKIDRIACPWLIKRFVDPSAVFLFVTASEVESVAERFDATPFDIENVFWSHRGEFCTFDVMVREFGLSTPPLERLATMVRAADTARLDLSPEAAGLLAASLGLFARRRPRAVERRDAAVRRVLSMVPRRDQGNAQLANQQGEAMTDVAANQKAASTDYAHGISFGEAFVVWLRVAMLSFGGPAGQIAVMHRILVEEKNWISEGRFLHALNYCMLLPGPEAQQLATYIGWLLHRTAGGIMAGVLFIVPGVIAIMGLSYIYAVYGNVGFVEALFFGLKAAVLAIVIQAVFRVGKRALRNRVMIAIAALAFIAIFFFGAPFPLIIVAAGLVGFAGARAGRPEFAAIEHGGKGNAAVDNVMGAAVPDHVRATPARARRVAAVWLALWLIPVGAIVIGLGPANVFSQIASFFSKMAMVTFGGAYAVLAYVAQQAADYYHWVQPREMLDGLGMAETTPGPLIMVVQFVGFMAAFRDAGGLSPLVAATLGGLLATWVTFTPCFLWIFLGAPYIEKLRGNKSLAGALTAITAAVVGVILNLSIWFALHTLFRQTVPVQGFGFAFDAPVFSSVDVPALVLSIAAATAIFRFNVGMLVVLAASCIAGVLLRAAGVI